MVDILQPSRRCSLSASITESISKRPRALSVLHPVVALGAELHLSFRGFPLVVLPADRDAAHVTPFRTASQNAEDEHEYQHATTQPTLRPWRRRRLPSSKGHRFNRMHERYRPSFCHEVTTPSSTYTYVWHSP